MKKRPILTRQNRGNRIQSLVSNANGRRHISNFWAGPKMTQSLKFDRLAGEAKSFGFFTVFLLKSDVIEKVYNGSSRKMLVPRRKTNRRIPSTFGLIPQTVLNRGYSKSEIRQTNFKCLNWGGRKVVMLTPAAPNFWINFQISTSLQMS